MNILYKIITFPRSIYRHIYICNLTEMVIRMKIVAQRNGHDTLLEESVSYRFFRYTRYLYCKKWNIDLDSEYYQKVTKSITEKLLLTM